MTLYTALKDAAWCLTHNNPQGDAKKNIALFRKSWDNSKFLKLDANNKLRFQHLDDESDESGLGDYADLTLEDYIAKDWVIEW